MRLRTVSSIYTMRESLPDDLFICSASFEERCLNAASTVGSGYLAKKSLVVRYTGEYREGYEGKLRNVIVPSFTETVVDTIESDRNDIVSFWYNLQEWFEDKTQFSSITVDISTFTKSFLLVLLKFLREKFPDAHVRILYTMAYYPTLSKNVRLSWGIKDVALLPYFGSLKNAKNGKNLLFLFLGYEAERAHSVWKFIEPTRTIAIVGDPPTYARAENPARSLNKFILNHPETVVERVSALNPMESKTILSTWYGKEEYKDYLFFVSPLGTKMQVVGTYLFFEEQQPFARAKVAYASPARYNEEKYSIGYQKGRVWEYVMPKSPVTESTQDARPLPTAG